MIRTKFIVGGKATIKSITAKTIARCIGLHKANVESSQNPMGVNTHPITIVMYTLTEGGTKLVCVSDHDILFIINSPVPEELTEIFCSSTSFIEAVTNIIEGYYELDCVVYTPDQTERCFENYNYKNNILKTYCGKIVNMFDIEIPRYASKEKDI